MKDYCVSVTYKCNWNCPYCSRDTHNKCTTHEEVVDYIDRVPDGSHVSLSGGEPGLLSTSELLGFISTLKSKKCNVDINTNGEIFKHPEVVEATDSIYYHCTVNMDLEDTVNKQYPDKTTYVVVVTDNNIQNLEPFILKHADINFVIHPATKGLFNSGVGETLSIKNILKLSIKYKDISDNQLMVLLDFNKTMSCVRFD